MFQFRRFPSIRYGLAYGCMRYAHTGFPIQTSADQWIFAPPRSFSQLITSFIGSQCQGIHPALFFAWPVTVSIAFETGSAFLKAFQLLNNYVYVWLFVQIISFDIFCSRMSWLKYHRYFFSILSVWSFQCTLASYTVLCFWPNGDGEIRTLDPLLARQVLSQLSYTPIGFLFSSLIRLSANGLKWTRTTDLTLIRRAL